MRMFISRWKGQQGSAGTVENVGKAHQLKNCIGVIGESFVLQACMSE